MLGLVLLAVMPWAVAGESLVFLHAIWRHGDRSPAVLIPTDTANPLESWPQGLGELTQKGMKQHYELGAWIRKKYGGFISQDYSAFEIHVRSTCYNRTIMSAQSNMAGLFMPKGRQRWNDSIAWQPVPIHTLPKEEDPMLYEQYTCPKEDDYYHNTVMKLPEVLAVMEKHKTFLDFVRTESGNPIPTLNDVYTVLDPLNCEREHVADGHVVPKWASESVFQRLKAIDNIATGYYCYNDKAKRLRGGVLVTDLIDRMKLKASGDSKLDHRLKLQAYSAHDTTLIVLLSTLGVFNNLNPPYASAVFVELYKDKSNNFTVKVLYRNDSSDGYYLSIPGCGSPCLLPTFASLFAKFHVEPEDVDPLCLGEGPFLRRLRKLSLTNWLWICGVLLSLVVGLLIGVVFLGLKFMRPRDGVVYSRLPGPTDDDFSTEPHSYFS